MHTKILYKNPHFTKKGDLIYLKSENVTLHSENVIVCSEDLAREIIPKHFLSEFPYKDEWFEILIAILEKEHYAYFHKIIVKIDETKIETDILRIEIRPELMKEVPNEIQEEIFKTIVNTLKEDRYASSSY